VEGKINNRWAALKLLDRDPALSESLNKYLGFNLMDNIKSCNLLNEANMTKCYYNFFLFTFIAFGNIIH